MAEDWFRKATWTASDRADFEARLNRARDYNRPQYLHIQAGHLAESKDPNLLQVTLALCDRVIADYPDYIQLSWAHADRAACLLDLGKIPDAVDALRRALEVERKRPNVRSEAWLDLGWIAVQHGLCDLYDECSDILVEFDTEIPFPVQQYRYHTIRAVIAAHNGETKHASTEAKKALDAAARRDSGFTYHKQLGLVGDNKPALHDKLLKWAAG